MLPQSLIFYTYSTITKQSICTFLLFCFAVGGFPHMYVPTQEWLDLNYQCQAILIFMGLSHTFGSTHDNNITNTTPQHYTKKFFWLLTENQIYAFDFVEKTLPMGRCWNLDVVYGKTSDNNMATSAFRREWAPQQ